MPVFHFANNADLAEFGRSELEPAMPVQDGLNKSVLDMLVAMEFAAYRQRWAAGIEMTIDADGNPAAPFKAGVDHVWIAENPGARFGDFDGAKARPISAGKGRLSAGYCFGDWNSGALPAAKHRQFPVRREP